MTTKTVEHSYTTVIRLLTRFLRDVLVSESEVEKIYAKKKDLSHIAKATTHICEELASFSKKHSPEEAHILLLSIIISLERVEDEHETFDLESTLEWLIAETEFIAQTIGINLKYALSVKRKKTNNKDQER